MSSIVHPKSWLSYNDQLDRLIERGLNVSQRHKALSYLQRLSYYRLSGYWFDFRERSEVCCPIPRENNKKGKPKTNRLALDEFKEGASFKDVIALYVFDKKLRLLVMDAIERIEIALRVDIAHLLGEYNSVAYLNKSHFHEGFSVHLDASKGVTKHHDWLSKHAQLINRSREAFILHNKKKYGLPLPIWVACEVWDFGTLSTLYAGLKPDDQDKISSKYGISNGKEFSTWLRSLNNLRNICAHHSRLWNRNIADQPKLPPVDEFPLGEHFKSDPHGLARPFLLICICQHFVKVINPNSTWGERVLTLLKNEFPDLRHLGLTLKGMGVFDGWQDLNWSHKPFNSQINKRMAQR